MSSPMDEFTCNSIRNREISSLYSVIRNQINVRTNSSLRCSRVLNNVQLAEHRKPHPGLNEASRRHIDLPWLAVEREFQTNYRQVLPTSLDTFCVDRSSNSFERKMLPWRPRVTQHVRSKKHPSIHVCIETRAIRLSRTSDGVEINVTL